MSKERDELYLGDAVYASFDGYHIWLRTSDGYRDTNRIGLEPAVLDALIKYRGALARKYGAAIEEPTP